MLGNLAMSLDLHFMTKTQFSIQKLRIWIKSKRQCINGIFFILIKINLYLSAVLWY